MGLKGVQPDGPAFLHCASLASLHVLTTPVPCVPPPPTPPSLRSPQEDPKYKAAMKVRNPERRLRVWASLCQTKRVCEHTGGPQPTYRLEHGTMKILAEFPKPKADDDDLAAEAVQESKMVSAQAAGWQGWWCRGLGRQGHGRMGTAVQRWCAWLRCRSGFHGKAGAHHGTPLKPPSHSPAPFHLATWQEITPEKALEILRRISDEDCRALGFDPRFSRPDFMILSVLPVPPPPVRPSVQMDSSAR